MEDIIRKAWMTCQSTGEEASATHGYRLATGARLQERGQAKGLEPFYADGIYIGKDGKGWMLTGSPEEAIDAYLALERKEFTMRYALLQGEEVAEVLPQGISREAAIDELSRRWDSLTEAERKASRLSLVYIATRGGQPITFDPGNEDAWWASLGHCPLVFKAFGPDHDFFVSFPDDWTEEKKEDAYLAIKDRLRDWRGEAYNDADQSYEDSIDVDGERHSFSLAASIPEDDDGEADIEWDYYITVY